jgi:hypothetical protein
MATSMLLPTVAAIALLALRAVEDTGVLLVAEHVAMLAGMLVLMLLRRDEYSHHHARAAVAAVA